MKQTGKQPFGNSLIRQAILLRLTLLILFGLAPASQAIAQSRVWISNPTNYQITYKLLFSRSGQNFTIRPGIKNVHTTQEYPPTFLADVNVNLTGYPQIKRFRLEQNRTYYFRITGNQLHLLKQPLNNFSQAPLVAPVTAVVRVYSLGGRNPIYHSSIILYNTSDPYINGREWSFWPSGNGTISNIGYVAAGRVTNNKPAGAGNPVKSFQLTTQQTPQMAAAIFNNLRNQWNQRPYRALDSNCNHFVDSVMVSLGAGRHPNQYQNSWGARVPQAQIQSAFANNYGVTCPNAIQTPVQPARPHTNNRVPQTRSPRQFDTRSEVISRILRGLGI